MSNLILNNKDLFRAERLFSERVCSPISTNIFFKSENAQFEEGDESITFNKSISRFLKNTKKYRIVNL